MSHLRLHNNTPNRSACKNPLDPYTHRDFVVEKIRLDIQRIQATRPLECFFAGAGANFYARVLNAIAPYAAGGGLNVVVADLNPDRLNQRNDPGVSYALIHNDDDLLKQMELFDLVLIETNQGTHPKLVRQAIAARVPIVLCEKPAGETIEQCKGLVDDVRRAFPQTIVLFVDHYLPMSVFSRTLEIVQGQDSTIPTLAVEDFSFALREVSGISPGQVTSQRQGAKEPLHHAVAHLQQHLGLDSWQRGPCYTATHHASPITAPTYAALSFHRPETTQTAHLLVAKMQVQDEKAAYLTDQNGRLLVANRSSHSIRVGTAEHLQHATECVNDSGYENLFAGLLDSNTELPPLLTVHEAMCILRFTEDALASATRLPFYPTDEWVPPGFGALSRARAKIDRWTAGPNETRKAA